MLRFKPTLDSPRIRATISFQYRKTKTNKAKQKQMQENQNNNPTDIDLSSLDPSFPLISGPQKLDLKVEKAELVPGSKNPDAKMLSLELSTTSPTTDINGDTMAPGARVFHRENYVPVGKLKIDQINRAFAAIVQSAGLSGVTLSGIDSWHKQLEGKVLKCNVIVEPAKDGYRARNSIGEFIKATNGQ